MSILTQETDLDALAKQLWALGDPVRLHILRILPTEPTCKDACNVSTIAERIGLSQPATSHHLRILRQAGLITNEKKCRDMIYWVQLDASNEVIEALREVLSSA
ncbi:MAG: metalloregulator ArsR/SmtB family transcription factor [Opitutae bacterium]|jgi:ArsR family transcriptional regulator, arsenate/arsenite/antimonite-responsive transcriptional repressor|nr:metalloregulator ArsR/SmtB family transcription factor [Opitutales bacterium]MDG1668433.1 metalloregulator ArsR/SmtB family transcription factor [Opitutae bacterium]MDB2310599.1 metalloregulator ArsR/SmtB family transcription factor [Opitutales bacterium]MDB2358151.1 metalloregulator ArsR/SmtB family transcription factor [Opitutales bacterium]MDB2506776.1 metalloregulator ArsR/SmtB family transcription factor [Opitutales bacterium]